MLDATLLFIPNISQQSHKQESKKLIEHTSRSTEDKPKITLNLINKICVVVRYGGQQDASTSKVSIRSANQKYHTTLSDNYISQPKVNEIQRCPSQRSTQNNSSKKSMQLGQSQ